MKNIVKISLILLTIIPNISFGQKIIKQEGDIQNGKGMCVVSFSNQTQTLDGYFKNGELHGKNCMFKILFLEDQTTVTLEGQFENGTCIDGIKTRKSQNQKIVSIEEGGFNKKNQLKGNGGKITEFYDGDQRISQGTFMSGVLANGTEIYTWKNGVQKKCNIKDGESIEPCLWNDRNNYNKNDVVGPANYNLNLTYKQESQALYIDVNFGHKKTSLQFDTGAYGIVLSKSDFQKLGNSGVKFVNLKQKTQSFGVANIPLETTAYKIDNFKIGEYTVNNVIVNYVPEAKRSLLGLGFWEKFANVKWDMKKNQIELVK